MAIYSEPVRVLMREMAKDLAKDSNDSFNKQQAISWFSQHYPKVRTGTVTAHLTRMSTNARSRTHHNIFPGEDDLFYQINRNTYRLYQPDLDPPPIYSSSGEIGSPPLEVGDDETEDFQESNANGEFAYESDLRNYLSKNLQTIESGMTLYEEEGVTGVEFPVGGRFIDILAIDSNNDLVVIELKVSKGYDRVIGQLLRYIAWIKENLADKGQKVRGIIIARNISDDLKLATSLVPDIQLYEYQLSLSLKNINRNGT